MIEFAKQFIDDTLLSVDGALTSMEAGLKPFDTEQMSDYQELMSGIQILLAIGPGLKSAAPTRKAINDKHKTFNPDQLSGVKPLKSFNETRKPIVDVLKSSAQFFKNLEASMHIYRPYPLYNCSCFSDQKT